MIKIEITNVNRNQSGYAEVTYQMRFVLPAVFGTTTNPINGLETIIKSYSYLGYSLEITNDSPPQYYILYTQTVPVALNIPLASIKTSLVSIYNTQQTTLNGFTLTGFDSIAVLTWNGTNWI